MTTVDDLFSIRYGHGLSLNALREVEPPEGVNFVSRGTTNNGVSARVLPPRGVVLGAPGELTVALNGEGGALASFLQPAPFVTGYHVAILSARADMDETEKLWWARCIWENHYRYGFGRQANRTLGSLKLPSGPPQWVDQIEPSPLGELSKPLGPPQPLPDLAKGAWFRLDDVFDIAKGRRLTKREQAPGNTPYIGSSAFRNGVTNWIDAPPAFPAGVLTVPYNGSVGHAFFQPRPFCAGDDVHVLAPRDRVASELSLLFIAAIIRAEKFKYSYGRKWNLTRMVGSVIRLPVTASGRPDHAVMEAFMRGLPFASAGAD